ncbi:hypothetical protein DFH01_02855 [Falsiroseomonas bella]|uniref:DUF1217 domain-containing protein n=1 Tax=Falsiroseomonas bella TaxID=2184016 RepID=A0A317FGQ7_9PROT|nr:DUF1217 domain-containing protein [Falsiroseomonas bella]PWS38251.1 hypothetical protein DFH01_02855 [Falsiroseomonas bella]
MLAGIGGLNALSVAERQGAALQDRFAARRDVAADMARFRERAPQIADAEALLKDRRTLTVVLEAFQLESEIDKRAMLRKVLTEDPAAEGSLVNRLTDPRWKQLAQAFAGGTTAPLADGALVERIVSGALTNRYEKAMGDANPGLREALYFKRMAGNASTIAQLMSDRALATVARGALGLPEQFGLLSFEQQRDLLTRRIDVADLKDPKAVSRMAQRYVAQLSATQTGAPMASLLDGSGSANGIATLAMGLRRTV